MGKILSWCVGAALTANALSAGAAVTSAELAETSASLIRVSPDAVVLAGAGGAARELRATLRLRLYSATIELTEEGGVATRWSGTLLRYDLQAAEPDHERTWTVWSREPLGYFQLVIDPVTRQHSYLAWMCGSILSFTAVTLTRSELIGLEDAVRERRPAGVVQAALAAMSLPDSVYGSFTSALHAPVRVTGVHPTETGGWQVTLGSQPGSREAVTLVSSDGSTWQRQ